MKKVLRVVALAEAASFLLLLVATVVKHTATRPEGVKVLGPLHGILFLGYVVLVILVAQDERWRIKRTLLALICAVLPLGGFIAHRSLIGPDPVSANA